jgi:hypothetical protein
MKIFPNFMGGWVIDHTVWDFWTIIFDNPGMNHIIAPKLGYIVFMINFFRGGFDWAIDKA